MEIVQSALKTDIISISIEETAETVEIERAETDPAQSILYVSEEGIADVTHVVTVQAVDMDGNYQTTGGDIFTLLVDHSCDPQNSFVCTPNGNTLDFDNALPPETTMTDNGDGTYSGSFTIISRHGTLSVSVRHTAKNKVHATYFDNSSWTEPQYADAYVSSVNIDPQGPLPDPDYISVTYTGVYTYVAKIPSNNRMCFRFRASTHASITIYKSDGSGEVLFDFPLKSYWLDWPLDE